MFLTHLCKNTLQTGCPQRFPVCGRRGAIPFTPAKKKRRQAKPPQKRPKDSRPANRGARKTKNAAAFLDRPRKSSRQGHARRAKPNRHRRPQIFKARTRPQKHKTANAERKNIGRRAQKRACKNAQQKKTRSKSGLFLRSGRCAPIFLPRRPLRTNSVLYGIFLPASRETKAALPKSAAPFP